MAAKPLLKPLSEQAIVITGATSGIGLATARKAARAGACVFLIARGEKDLARLTEELQATGARVAHAVADVADFDALSEAAEKCGRLFGGFDTWVNNAGISIFGSIREVSLEDQRRLFETNYWGVVNGSMIAADHLRRRPGGGTIVNVGSTLSDAPVPIQGVYSASKHAVKGFTNAFRMELMRDRAPVAVSLVKPSAIDTPYNRHARNLTGQAVQNPQPVYATPVVADTILWCATHPIREITVGGGGRIIASFYAALPGLAEPLFARFAPVLMRDKRGEYRPYEDGLWDPADDGLEEEVHYPMVRGFSTLAEIRKHPGVTAGIVAVLAGIGLGALLLSQRSGPTRYERLRETVRPSRWLERVQPGRRLRDAGHQAHEGWDRLGTATQHLLGRKSGDRAVSHDRDPAQEGTAMAALTTIAAAIGAVALKQWQDRR